MNDGSLKKNVPPEARARSVRQQEKGLYAVSGVVRKRHVCYVRQRREGPKIVRVTQR